MLSSIKKRRSIRRFKSTAVEKDKLREVLFAAMCSPSAYHKYPWDFIVVKDKAVRGKLSRATNYSRFVQEAPVTIAIVGDADRSKQWIEDCAIVGAHIYLEAENQKLGSCMVQIRGMETPDGKDSEKYVRKILGIPEARRVLCLMAVGYANEKLEEHDEETRFFEGKVHEGAWQA